MGRGQIGRGQAHKCLSATRRASAQVQGQADRDHHAAAHGTHERHSTLQGDDRRELPGE